MRYELDIASKSGGSTRRFGIVASEPAPTRQAWLERVRAIDDLGHDTLLLPDHFGIWPPFSPLVAAAGASDRLRFGVQVVNNEFWNPALLAREAATADILTGGRLELGFGAGHAKAEFEAIGIAYDPPTRRVARLQATVPVVRSLLAGERVAHQTLGLRNCTIGVSPVQQPVPVMVGGNGDRLLAIAAQHGEVVSLVGYTSGTGQVQPALSHFTWEGLADRVAHVADHAGARFARLELSMLVQAVVVTDDRRKAVTELAAAHGQDRDVLLDSPFMMIGSVAHIAEQIERLGEDHGVTYITTFEPNATALATAAARLSAR